MRAGTLRHSVTIQSKSESVSAHGEMTDTWSTHATVYARINPARVREDVNTDQVVPRITHEVTIRSLSTVTPDMRILFGSRYLYIVGVKNADERNIMMMLDCEERDA